MSEPLFTLLPEGTEVAHYLDDPLFTEVTEQGEVYTLFRVVRITHEVSGHPEGWTLLANVTRERNPAIGTALLRVESRSIEESKVSVNRSVD
ncbi:MAG: hypothetical protein RL383_422 [Actinomycetota bacterium]|jgi:hypothetical protein